MKRNKLSMIIYALIGLAAIGLLSQLFGNTANFLIGILVSIGIAVIIFGFLHYFLQRGRGASTNEMKKYKQAVKQSKVKYQQYAEPSQKKQMNSKQRKTNFQKPKRRATHLRVIDGTKPKDKEKANF